MYCSTLAEYSAGDDSPRDCSFIAATFAGCISSGRLECLSDTDVEGLTDLDYIQMHERCAAFHISLRLTRALSVH